MPDFAYRATEEAATDCDTCHDPIPYGVTCYAVPTGETWGGDDADRGKPVIRVVCAACYSGLATGDIPSKAVLASEVAE